VGKSRPDLLVEIKMALLKIDISKLTPSQTWQVIWAVVFISGVSFFGQRLAERSESKKLDSIETKVDYINAEQSMLSEDVAQVGESQKQLSWDIADVKRDLVSVHRELEDKGDDLSEIVTLFRDQDMFTPEQMEHLLDEWLKKNSDRIVSDGTRLPGPYAEEYTAMNQK